MALITVAIKQDRIDNATRLNVANPLTKAIGVALGRIGCYIIGGIAFDAGLRLFRLTDEMIAWNIRWMAGENLLPQSFQVEVPDALMGEVGLHDDSED
jgi:hypothetical protein